MIVPTLDRYRAQREITAGQYRAGARFAKDARLGMRLWRERQRNPLARSHLAAEREAAERLRLLHAHLARHGADLWDVLEAVVVRGVGAYSWAREHGMRGSDGLPMLRRALERVAEHDGPAADDDAA